jgi:phosphoribosylformylglycinamidine cyclo-ligase
MSLTYKDAGVDIDAQDKALAGIKERVRSTFNDSVLRDIGSFGAMFSLGKENMVEPVLVASADGVGTKLKIAFMTDTHDTIGMDLVNHCVNDILVQGAKPLFFMDYIATGTLKPDVTENIVKGLADGCRENGLALIGGELAEMPDFYSDGEYDVAGFIVGIADRQKILDGSNIKPGDVVLGLASSGLHTNGYSLARKILFDICGFTVNTFVEELKTTVGTELLKVHRSYKNSLFGVLDDIKGIAHITGGGLIDNIPRILPEDCDVEIDLGSWDVPPIFRFLQENGDVPQEDMIRTFNLGIGMAIVVDDVNAGKITKTLEVCGETVWEIGTVVDGNGTVRFSGEW